MNIDPIVVFLAAIIAATSVILIIPWLAVRRIRKRLHVSETALMQAVNRIDATGAQFKLVDGRIDALANQLDRTNLRQTRLDSLAGKAGFEEAKELTRRGAGASELISACGLNGGEARLVRTLYGCTEN